MREEREYEECERKENVRGERGIIKLPPMKLLNHWFQVVNMKV